MAKGTSALIPLTSEEKDLLKVAVRLACAIQYWDKHSERIKEEERENWFHDGIADEMQSVNEIVLGFDKAHPDKPLPRVHPLINLIGEEYRLTDEENRKIVNFHAFARDVWVPVAKVVKATEPTWPNQLTNLRLTSLIKNQDGDHWWLPGDPGPDETEDDDDEMEDDDDEMGTAPHATEQSEGEESAVPMEEDEHIKTPPKSRAQKRAMIASPSEQDAHPARRIRVENPEHFCGPCKKDRDPYCTRQPAEKKNARACETCAEKKRTCHPPPIWPPDPEEVEETQEPAERKAVTVSAAKPTYKRTQRQRVGASGGNTLTLESLRSEMEAHFTDITDRLANVESLLRALYVSSGGQPSTLGLRRPPVPPFHSVSSNAPITSSAIGSASTASAVNVSGLSLDGPSAFETSGTGTSKGKGKDKALAPSPVHHDHPHALRRKRSQNTSTSGSQNPSASASRNPSASASRNPSAPGSRNSSKSRSK